MTALEIKDIFKGFETVDLYYIKTDADGHEVIWRKSSMIKDGQEKIMHDGFFHNAEFRPEGVDEHTYLVNFLHKLEERRKQDVDEDDNTIFTFHDDSDKVQDSVNIVLDPTGDQEGRCNMKWYAVQKDRMDQWDNGSHDYHEAVEMLEAQGCGLIAIIDEDTGCCVEEIEYEDVCNEN